MSTPKSTATNAPPGSNPCGSKREACDRCRSQKIRCLRKEQGQDSHQAKCVRCFKAGAHCNFGISIRTGRPPGSKAPSTQERGKNGTGKPKKGAAASRRATNTSGHQIVFDSKANAGQYGFGAQGQDSDRLPKENTIDQESEGETEEETEDTALINPLQPSSLHDTSDILHDTSDILNEANIGFPPFSGSSNATLPWPDDTLSSFYIEDAGEAPSLEPFTPEYSWAFHQYQEQSMDIQLSTASPISYDKYSRDAGNITYGTPPHICSTNSHAPGVLDEAMDLDLPSGSNHVTNFNHIKALDAQPTQAQYKETDNLGSCTSFSMSSIAKTVLFKDLTGMEAGMKPEEEAFSVSKIQYQRTLELSGLAADLHAQLAANDLKNHQSAHGAPPTGLQDQLIGSVLKSSNSFLTLVASFSTPVSLPSSPSRPSHHSPSTKRKDSSCSCGSSSCDVSPSTSAPDDENLTALNISLQPAHARKLSVSNSNDSRPPSPLPLDVTTILQLLVCHIRIIHLHSIMYARILDYVLTFLHSPTTAAQNVDSAVPPVFPHMQVGGVSLDKFGMFQVKLLLQISVHVLGEIELALGLPVGYRVGKKDGEKQEKRGILEAIDGAGFVECLMREGVWKGENERVQRVREQLESLRIVLKGTIDF
ncbi:hypothetical protein MMC14_009615 [Varicellaria rhodocarpa]|nr:hypothetical protein [Varicellaria rhodocarpa]